MKEILAWSEYCKSLAPAVAQSCALAPVSAGPGALLKELAGGIPDWQFRHVFCRGGWYRLGGVLARDGSRVSDNLESWAQDALDERDGDFAELAEDFAGQSLFATRLVGRTHYLISPAGDGPTDFLQLEIEDLQEVRGHQLFSGDSPPSSLEELVDPRGAAGPIRPVGMAHYRFRRLVHVGSVLARMLAQRPEPAPIHRMTADWGASSAGQTSAFHNHWVVALGEHLDRYQQTLYRAQPFATLAGEPPEFGAGAGTSGLSLHEALVAFDRAVGYPMAWYFHLLSSKAVPHWVAQAVVEDALAGFAYLPQKDVEVVRGWLHRPYAV
ncbi:MAG: hypothetical protein PHU46_14430 [Rhodocyclaceae bacterium]|nr:hypothetical protein [Rhodocyclaceae bacterium]